MPKRKGPPGGYHYRDKSTGKFVPKQTWLKNKGTRRFKRERQNKGRYDKIKMATGYNGREDKSYTLVVIIQRKKKETLQHVSDRIAHLAGEGYFDNSPNNPVRDLTWATFHNEWEVIERGPSTKRKPAELVDFERIPPSLYVGF